MSAAPRTVRDLLHDAERRLLAAFGADDVDDARLQVELLYARASGVDRASVIAGGGDVPPEEIVDRFSEGLERRLRHEPLAYILGRREFYGLSFEVGPGCLVPRPETETLVEAALGAIHEHPRARRQVLVADVGTGSGAVGIAVARHAPTVKLFGTDVSTVALEWAGRNRRRLDARERVVLLAGELLEPVPEPVDIVLANLPYVPTAEFERLPPQIRAWEPRGAVDGGEDGLVAFRGLAGQLPAHLASGPVAVLLEVGAGQTPLVQEMMIEAMGREDLRPIVHRDLRGNRRVVEIRAGY